MGQTEPIGQAAQRGQAPLSGQAGQGGQAGPAGAPGEYPWSERMRMIRFRRKKESLRFWQEFKVVPRWLIGTVVALTLLAEAIAMLVNWVQYKQTGEIFPPNLAQDLPLAQLALAGIVLGIAVLLGSFILLFGYVYRDAKRRGMSAGLWTFLVIVLFPAYFAIGFIIYFLLREPLPYACPRCGTMVGARFNFCPNCQCNLHPACANCKREVAETDKFCPYCGEGLRSGEGESQLQLAQPEGCATKSEH